MNFQFLKKKFGKTFVISFFISIVVSMLLLAGFMNTWESKISDAFY